MSAERMMMAARVLQEILSARLNSDSCDITCLRPTGLQKKEQYVLIE